MPNYTLAELEALVRSKGEGTRHDTSRDHVPVQDRIVDAIIRAGQPLSRGEIAEALGLKKTPWLMNAIEGLVYRGVLTRYETIRYNGMLMYFYEVKS
jgi:DNA-binding GntR family transcriptional regulator